MNKYDQLMACEGTKLKTHLDLFSGVGGFSLASGWAGYETVQFVEIEPFCQKVLAKNFSGVPIHGDIKTYDATELRGRINLLTGGFPCQPYSVAGSQKGVGDDRALWPEMLRVIKECRPRFVLGENVPGLIGLGIDAILSSLETEGYSCQTISIPASAIGAAHRRERIWILAADMHNDRLQEHSGDGLNPQRKNIHAGHPAEDNQLAVQTDTNANNLRELQSPWSQPDQRIRDSGVHFGLADTVENLNGREHWLDALARVCRMAHGLPRGLHRIKRLRALGNAIVPQVAYEIIRCIPE